MVTAPTATAAHANVQVAAQLPRGFQGAPALPQTRVIQPQFAQQSAA